VIDKIYQNAISTIINNGDTIESRNSIVKSYNVLNMRFTSTPLISVRKTAWKSSIREMEWFLSGSTNINDLHESVRKWWTPWSDESGELPYTYGKQFREGEGNLDQVQYLIDCIRQDPDSRRNVISLWNTYEMTLAPLPCCHGSLISTYVTEDDELCLNMVQRSADMILGVPHNIIQYWAFLLYLGYKTNKKIGHFNWIGLNCHIYEDHLDAARNILNIEEPLFDTPKLIYTPTSGVFKADDFKLDREYVFSLNPKLQMTV
jgi:thymidylate synthase